MDKYFMNLWLQFLNAKNVKYRSYDEFNSDFCEWVFDGQRIGEKYLEFLDSLDLNYDSFDTAEVGKSGYDSIVKKCNSSIITSVCDTFYSVEDKRVIPGEMIVVGRAPLISKNKKLVSCDYINTYMTQNPFNRKDISGWYNLHNSGNYDIIAGVFGDIHDKDINTKIKMLKDLRGRLVDDFVEEYSTLGDNYFYVVGSKRKLYKLDKLLERTLHYSLQEDTNIEESKNMINNPKSKILYR